MPVSSALIGRAGNSLFHIACSIGYARKYGYEWSVQSIPHNNESAIHKIFPNLPKTNDKGNRFQEHPNKHCGFHDTHFDLCHFDYHPLPDMGGNIFLVGFWQSWKYFEHCKEEVKKVFALPHVEGYEHYCSIHIRLGDYKQHSGSFPPVTEHYLLLAMMEIEREKPNSKYMVFSDGIDECKEIFRTNFSQEWNDRIYYSEGRNELQDLSLMASCGHHIIANSTFSWWAAYLGHNHDRIVITPSADTWFGPTSGVKRPVVDLLLPEWHQIKTR